MSNDQISIFRHEGVDLRVTTVDGEPWFVAADVARMLGHRDANDMTRTLDDDEKGYEPVRTPGGTQRMNVINEEGLYRAVMRRELGYVDPESLAAVKAFQRWVTHEVLPSIRRTGGYSRAEVNALPQSYGEALRMLADEVEARAALAAKVEADAPKVEYVDEFVDHDDVVLFRVAANELGIPEKELRDRLVTAGWVYKTLIGTRWSRTQGREVREFEYRAAAAHADKFRSMPQHNAPRHHNGQVRTTLYIRSAALPSIRRRVTLTAVTA